MHVDAQELTNADAWNSHRLFFEPSGKHHVLTRDTPVPSVMRRGMLCCAVQVTFVGPGFTRKPPKYERFIRPTGAQPALVSQLVCRHVYTCSVLYTAHLACIMCCCFACTQQHCTVQPCCSVCGSCCAHVLHTSPRPLCDQGTVTPCHCHQTSLLHVCFPCILARRSAHDQGTCDTS
jgi:hypothetical protein